MCRKQPAVERLQVYTQTLNAEIGLKWHVNQCWVYMIAFLIQVLTVNK